MSEPTYEIDPLDYSRPKYVGKPKKITVASKAKGTRDVPLRGAHIRSIEIERLQPGIWARPAWNEHQPFQKVRGIMYDPRSGDEDTHAHVVWWHGGGVSQHMPAGTMFHGIFKDRRKE